MRESETIEFKKTTGELNQAVVSIAAILNKHRRGELYLGIKNDGTPFTQEITDSTLRDVSRKIYEAIKPQIFPTIEVVEIEGVEVIKVSFEGDDVPYSSYGRYYVRVADEDRELTPAELRKIMVGREYEENWSDRLTDRTVEDVKVDSLESFYRSATECGRLPDIGFDVESLLLKHDLMRNGRLTNAGYVLFGNDEPVSLRLAVFATKERTTILDLELVKGNVYDLIRKGVDFLVKNIRWRVDFPDDSFARRDIPEIPLSALREAVINSFAHARYDGHVMHEIDVYSDRVAITNPGSFASDHQPSDYFTRNLNSHLRNRSIAEILYLCKDAESCGQGLKKAYRACRDAGVDIDYVNNETDFTIVFSRRDRNDAPVYDGKLSDDESAVLAYLGKKSKAVKEDIVRETGLPSRTVDRIIAKLKDKQLLRRVGSNKSGRWEIFG